jgi:hypothetical protein
MKLPMTHVYCYYTDNTHTIIQPSDSLPRKPHKTHANAGYEPVYFGVRALIEDHNIC